MREQQKRVILFSTPTCSWCKRARGYLRRNRIRFKEVDVSRDERAMKDVVRMTGQMGVPVILIGNRPIVGFNKPEIDRLLQIKPR